MALGRHGLIDWVLCRPQSAVTGVWLPLVYDRPGAEAPITDEQMSVADEAPFPRMSLDPDLDY